MTDLELINKLAEMKEEELNNDTVIGFSDYGKPIKINEIYSIYLWETDIEKIPETIGKLTSLQSLDVSNTQLTSLPESIGNLTGLTSLDVSNTQLTSLPESIGNLTGLHRLNISSTQLTSLPESIGNMTGLASLDIRETQLRSLPESIGKLTGLRRLSARETQLRSLPESIGNLTGLQSLYVKGNHLTSLPESIGNLTGLQSLDVRETQLRSLPESIGKLTGLQRLDVRETQLRSLPESIGNLTSLRSLDVSGTQLRSLPESVGKLTGLQNLDVSGTQLASLPESIGKLTGLTSLDVRETQLTSLPEEIGNLTNLLSLDVSSTQLTSLPESIENLTSLQRLGVREIKLTSLPESIGNLTSLLSLDASRTQLRSLPKSIGNLTGLQSLNVNCSQLTNLPDSIGNLPSLQNLDVSWTPLINLPESIGNLTGLLSLQVNGTQLTSLPESIGNLSSLWYLDISKTLVKSIPACLSKIFSIRKLILQDLSLDRLPDYISDLHVDFITKEAISADRMIISDRGIYIHNLSLSKQPISLFYQKRELIEQYYSEEKVFVNSAKIIFLGDGEVGKTYTLKRLLNQGKKATDENMYPTQTTHGVLIKPYSINDRNENYGIKLWDFGGQQIMHSMHRCFLTERSCYVVVISTRTDRDLLGQARYWLRTVNSFAPNSPVIVLVNQWTKNLIRVDEFRLKEEFKNIQQFLYFSVVDAKDDEFLSLKNAIIEQVRKLDCYGMEFPKSWYELMTDLENETHDLISKRTYYQKCFEKGLRYEDNADEGIYEWLLDWFNDLGVCFSYHKKSNSQILDNYELLNPQWLTRAAYVLINNGMKEADNGILTRKQIESVLSDTEPLDFDDLGRVSYKSSQIDYILEILRKFQISYQLPDRRELIPVLCDENSSGSIRPEWFIQNEMQHTSYEFQYEYLPDIIIHRLMIFCYQSHFNVRYRWRKGMTVDFSSDDSSRLTAVIDSGNDRQSITIDIYSDGRIPCWQFLSKLREEIIQINTEINLKAKDYINMETDGIKDRFSVEAVLKKRARGWTILPADKYDGDYQISDILGSAYGPVNAAFIEKLSVSQKGLINSESINQILSILGQLMRIIEKIDDRSKNIEIVQYNLKDQITDEFANVLQKQDAVIALLDTLNKEPSLYNKARKGILSGVAVTADIVTLITAANPDLPASICENAAIVLEKLIQMIG